MKTDIEIQTDVMEELKWEPILNTSQIGVAVKNGIVTLSGQVDSYSKKLLAEKAAKRVAGVKAIAEDILVGVSPYYSKTDAEIAEAVLNALKWHTMIPEEKIKVSVDDGIVKLEGEVPWAYQQAQAKSAIEDLLGVRSVINLITIKPNISASDIQKKINAAFHRSATIDSHRIKAEVSGSSVKLTGVVSSFAQKEDAENAVWFAPGVTNVKSELVVEEPGYSFED